MVPRPVLLSLFSLLLVSSPASADFSTGSTGADGAFSPGGSILVDLSMAGSGPGTGAYDPVRWAVVFNYTTIDIPPGVTVSFKNHPSGAPVVWLAQGEVHVSGMVILDGANGGGYYNEGPFFAKPGPGGFEGGRREIDATTARACAGMGPGGAPAPASGYGGGGGYGTPGRSGSVTAGGVTYGNPHILPLIGGSGGAAGNEHAPFGFPFGGGAGGGAILIASPNSIHLDGGITANGGAAGSNPAGPGSGGAIRLRAPSVSGLGFLRAVGGAGSTDTTGMGRICVEATSLSVADVGIPLISGFQTPDPVFPDATTPTLRATLIDATPVPADPVAGIESIDAVVGDIGMVTLQITATNINPGTVVDVILVPDGDTVVTWPSSPLVGTAAASTATATFPMDRIRRTEIMLRADTGSGPVLRALDREGSR